MQNMGGQTKSIMVFSEVAYHYVPLCSNNFRNSPNLTFYRIPRDENNFSVGASWIKLVI